MNRRSPVGRILMISALVLGLATPAAFAQWEIKTEDGNSSIKFGFLAVMRADSEELANGEDAQNLYFRRLRLLFGGKLTEKWSYFFETDSPNLGKSDSAGSKNAGDVYIQDFFVTYNQSKAFKVDLGMILIPLSRNSTQSAATHLASDYGPYSFLNSGPTNSRVGRDYGVQLRGAVASDRLEYRVGVYDGNRGENASADFRYAARVAFNVFDTETGMFYTGNNLGKKRQLAFGLSYDTQDDYDAVGADVFFDQPVGDIGAFTLQGDYIAYDGGTTFVTLPKQSVWLVEVGYLFGGARLQPWIQYAERDFDSNLLSDESQTWIGLNYRIKGHNQVLRFAYGMLERDGADDRDVLQLTLQIFQF
jgi:hypothetical protein